AVDQRDHDLALEPTVLGGDLCSKSRLANERLGLHADADGGGDLHADHLAAKGRTLDGELAVERAGDARAQGVGELLLIGFGALPLDVAVDGTGEGELDARLDYPIYHPLDVLAREGDLADQVGDFAG